MLLASVAVRALEMGMPKAREAAFAPWEVVSFSLAMSVLDSSHIAKPEAQGLRAFSLI